MKALAYILNGDMLIKRLAINNMKRINFELSLNLFLAISVSFFITSIAGIIYMFISNIFLGLGILGFSLIVSFISLMSPKVGRKICEKNEERNNTES